MTARHAKSFDVLERTEIEVGAGDRLSLTANWRDLDFRATNGEIVTLSAVNSQGRIELSDGRILPANYRQFKHGYAVTAHRSQGKTVDSVIISADGMRKELFYVAASRGRRSVVVVTSDKEGLRHSVSRSAVRKSASELAGRMPRCCPRGERRGLAAARELVIRAAMYVSSLPRKIRREVTRRECMNTVSGGSGKAWILTGEERANALEIPLLKCTYVLPWSQFLYAEGGADEVRLVFALHDVTVRGSGLGPLLADVAAQRVALMREPPRADRFSAGGVQLIRETVVQKVEAEPYGR